MARKTSEISRIVRVGAALAFTGFVLTGCASSLGDFGLERPQPTSQAAAPAAQTANPGAPVQPTALFEAAPLPPANPTPAAQAAASVPGATATGLFPTGNTNNKLLTPEEKAAVIAELEALARSQKVVPPSPPRVTCDDPSLDLAERVRREAEGIAC